VACLAAGVRGAEPDNGQTGHVPPWTLVDAPLVANIAAEEVWVQPERYQAALLDVDSLTAMLAAAPLEKTVALSETTSVLTLPTPEGSWARFAFVEAPVMAPELAAKYPQIRTYVGRGIDDPTASCRFDLTPAGFHAQVLSPDGAVYIDPLWRHDRTQYACYYTRDLGPAPEGRQCLLNDELLDDPVWPGTGGIAATGTPITDDALRTYRLACAATGEYTAYHGGTVASGLAAVVTAINRVTGIYELEAGIRLELVANNDLIIYTSAATDPYSNYDGYAMLSQNQATLTNVIGSANYDIGHVFSTGGGGIAALQAVCRNTRKAQGVTGLSAPVGDWFYVDYVAHEMGHQFGGNHSFNGITGNCSGGNRNGSTAFEPGSGSTIMAYAGICGGDNLQSHSDPYFHLVNLVEITTYSRLGTGSTCAAESVSGNTPPMVDAGPDYTIPKQTPFVLTATGSDPDGDAVTYAWEQYDLGPGVALSAPDDGFIPLFRSFDPTTDPSRTFPRLASILSNTSSTSEKLPAMARDMDFRVSARDNHAGAGGVAYDSVRVTVDGDSGPFRVLTPDSADVWYGGGLVTWDVAGTDAAPVSAAFVDILLSTDGGLTFPHVLAAATPNDGSEFVSTSTLSTASARIKVQGSDNIFFDINDFNFAIENCAAGSPPIAEPDGVLKNRYVAFVAPTDPTPMALQVRLANLPPPFDGYNGETRWVGPPAVHADGVGGSFVAARLQCNAYYHDWSTIGLLHVYGEAVVPSASYAVEALACAGGIAAATGSLAIETGVWGDVVAPFAADGTSPQPDFTDIAAVVATFIDAPGNPGKARAQLQPGVPDPAAAIDFKDIADAVQAFLNEPYPYSGPTGCF